MNKKEVYEFIKALVGSVVEEFTLPTGDTALYSFYVTLVISGITFISNYFGFYTFLSNWGCVIAILVMGIILFIERNECDALSRLFRNDRVCTKGNESGRKSASTNKQSERPSTGSNTNSCEAQGRSNDGT